MLDIEYYLHKQILPPVERLCAPVSGTDITRLADCLGLDTTKYRVSSASSGPVDAEIQPLESQVPDAIRFKDSTPLHLRCLHCSHSFVFRGLAQHHSYVTSAGIQCPASGCGAVLPTLAVAAQTEAQIRQHTAQYYAGWLVCDDSACGARTRAMSVYGHRCLGPKGLGTGCLGRMRFEYGEKALYNQLLYFQSIFDMDKAKDKTATDAEVTLTSEQKEKVKVLAEVNRERFDAVKACVRGYLEKSGRLWVAMDTIFSFALQPVLK